MAKEDSKTDSKKSTKLNQAGEPVKPSVFAIPLDARVGKRKSLLAILANKRVAAGILAVALLLVVGGVVLFFTNRSNDQNIAETTVDTSFEEFIKQRDEDIRQSNLGNELAKQEVRIRSIENEDQAPEQALSPDEQFDAYANAAYTAALVPDDSAQDYAKKALDVANSGTMSYTPGESILADMQRISSGNYTTPDE